MNNWFREKYEFKITVISVGTGEQTRRCRNGHEAGDACPEGFCSKCMIKVFPLMEAVRSGGNLSNLMEGASKHCGEFVCPDGVVRFLLEAKEL